MLEPEGGRGRQQSDGWRNTVESIEAYIMIARGCRKWEKEYREAIGKGKKPTRKAMSGHEALRIVTTSPFYADLKGFLDKYPSMPRGRLAELIAARTEYPYEFPLWDMETDDGDGGAEQQNEKIQRHKQGNSKT